MYIREAYNLEFKEKITSSFLKTVSAYANYNDGKIIFGLDNAANPSGIDVSDEERLRIENMINDSFEPVPRYGIEIDKVGDIPIVVLTVRKGKDTPYYYKGKAYRRADTSTVLVDRYELNRLIMEGLNIAYEENRATGVKLSFNYLESYLKKEIGIDKINEDILRTLKLYDKEGYYNIAGELLADSNEISFSGIDMIRFGDNINQILDRETLTSRSVLWQYDEAIKVLERYYLYEEIEGYRRIKKELIPREAFREAIANAIVHRSWDINSFIQVAMYKDRVEINSPGGLPAAISREDYIHKNISILKNPIIAGVFYRLNIIEQFGTGITRIMTEYHSSREKPIFDIGQNYIRIILPIMQESDYHMSKDESIVYNLLQERYSLSRAEIESLSHFNKSKTLRVINNMIDEKLIVKEGQGPATKYKLS